MMAGDISAQVWKEGFGFDLWDIDQMLEFHSEDANISIFRGEFDESLLAEAWDHGRLRWWRSVAAHLACTGTSIHVLRSRATTTAPDIGGRVAFS